MIIAVLAALTPGAAARSGRGGGQRGGSGQGGGSGHDGGSAGKEALCHANRNGTFRLLNVSSKAVARHLAHGDARPGEPVPGMAGYLFDDQCKPVADDPANVAPVVTTSAGSTAFTEDGGAVTVDGAVTVTDVDDTLLDFATVTITNLLDGASEVLAASAAGGIGAGDISYGAGVLTIDPAVDQLLADFQAVLQSVTYDNSSEDPDTTDRVVQFVANDGDVSSSPGAKTVSIAAVNDPPTANPDSYDAVGNTELVVGTTYATPSTPFLDATASDGVLGNDSDPDHTLAVLSVDVTGLDGTLTIDLPSGEFKFLPDVGYTGTTSFTYLATDGVAPPVGPIMVEIAVSDLVWYIDNSVTGGGDDGRSPSPFETMAAFRAVQGGGAGAPGPGDYIYLHNNGGGTYQGGIGMVTGQALIGQGVDLVIGLETLAGATTKPTLTNSAGNGIFLADNNSIEALIVSGTSASGIVGDGVTVGSEFRAVEVRNSNIDNVALVNATSGVFEFDSATQLIQTAGSGSGLIVNAAAVDVNFDGTIEQGASGHGLRTVGTIAHTGTMTFSASSSVTISSGSGFVLANADGTYNFNGTINKTNLAGAFDISGGSSGTFAFTGDVDAPGFRIFGPVGTEPTLTITGPFDISGVAGGVILRNVNIGAAGATINSVTITSGDDKGVDINRALGTGTITFNSLSIVVDGAALGDIGFFVTSSSAPISVGGGTVSALSERVISFENNTGAIVATFTGATIPGGSPSSNAGIVLHNNTGGSTFNFSGINVTTTGGTGFHAHNSGTVNVTGATNTISATGGRGVDIQNTTVGSAGVTFQSVTSTGSLGDGIKLLNTGSSGTFTVGGGTLAGAASGIDVSNTHDVVVTGMSIGSVVADGVRVSSANSFALNTTAFSAITGVTANLTNSTVSGSGNTDAAFSCNDGGGNTGSILFNAAVDSCP